MNRFRKLLVFLILGCLFFTACGIDANPTAPGDAVPSTGSAETVDYAAAVKLDMSSATAKQEVTVKSFIDGDTTHFYVPRDVMENGVLKARFLAINTPESTGKIEEYGKKAAQFTKEKLSGAASIIIESETGEWNPDSTGGRYLVWVWYKTADMTDYRNLNIEILQNGLALPNSAAGNQYGTVCVDALEQAKREKLNLYSGQKDKDFYYGEAVELTLKELRTNIESYNGKKVAFCGVVTSNSGNQGIYVEDYDSETGLYFGMYIYYGHGLSGTGLDILSVGNLVRIVGSVQYYEAGGTWQVSDLSYRMMQPDDPGNIQKLGEGHSASFVLTDPDTFVNGQVSIQTEADPITAPYAQMALNTSVEMQGLKVVKVKTTEDEDSASKGDMTLICEAGGVTVQIRTGVLLDENGTLITADRYLGKTIDVRGFVDYFNGGYQIKVLTHQNIIIK